MKIIFLDFDGVINSTKFLHYGEDNDDKISSEMVSRVNHIIEKTGAKVVISSDWRRYHDIPVLKEILEDNGFEGEVIDETPYISGPFGLGTRTPESPPRGELIARWLEENPSSWDTYVVLDDRTDMGDIDRNKFINTDTHQGLTDRQAEKAIEILEGENGD
jgi:microsomal dipeptidase-like Zn-dependent dipeptidase